MAESISALVIDLEGPVKSIKDLKTQIETLSVSLAKAGEDSEGYAQGVALLTKKQDELARATSLMKAQNTAAKDSYYALNKQLVESRKAYKNLTEAERNNAEIGGTLLESIADLDKQLKDMDATMGQYQRNVGNYEIASKAVNEQMHDLADAFKATALQGTTLGKATDGLDKTTKLLAKNPIMGIITLLLPILMKVVQAVKENETAMAAVKKIMESLQPVMDLCSRVIEILAEKFAKLAEKVAALIGKLFKGKGGASAGGGERGDNLEEATTVASSKMSEFREEVDATTEAIKAEIDALNELNKAMANEAASIDEATRLEAKRAELRKGAADEAAKLALSAVTKDTEVTQENTEATKDNVEVKEDLKKAAVESYSATSSMLSALADIYEANSEADSKAAKKAKNLRIASTIMDTLEGATAAYMNSVKAYKTPAVGIAMGALNAAIVAAAGMANVAKIRSTDTSGSSATSAATASVTAPAVSPTVNQTATVTGASQQTQINSRAYIVWSDLEGAMQTAGQRSSETSW